MRNKTSCVAVIFAAILAVAGSVSAQPPGPAPVGSAPLGPAPMGPPPIGAGPLGPGPIPPAGLIAPMITGMPAMRLASTSEQDRQDREKEAEQRQRERESRLYDQAREDIDNGRYDRAIGRFNDAIARKGPHADAALYFKAWAQDRVGQRAEALTTIATLNKEYPKSRWLPQAKQLEALVRQNSGQPARPDDQTDDDTKMYALNGLMNADPEKAIPMVEKLLEGTSSPRVKSKALFVLAQNDSPRAREVLKKVAMGTSAPDLQNRAIDYLGTQGGRDSR